jgi:hypothetical protein
MFSRRLSHRNGLFIEDDALESMAYRVTVLFTFALIPELENRATAETVVAVPAAAALSGAV